MKGLRRTEEGAEATQHLTQFSLDARGVQLLDKSAAAAGNAAGGAQRAYSALTNEEDLDEAGDDAMRGTPSALRTAGANSKKAIDKGKKLASPKRDAKSAGKPGRGVRGAGGGTRGQVRTRNIAATTRKPVQAAKNTARVGTTASKTAITASRAAAAVANIARAVIASVTTTLTSSPILIIVAITVGVVVLIISIVGWLIPGVQQEQGRTDNGNYPVGVEPGPWGGHSNGFIPQEALAEIPWAPGSYLRSDAVAALVAMNEEFKAEFGYNLGISDAYRDFAGQVEAERIYGDGAAEPGTSNHGWALAVDFGTGIASFNTPQYRWMKDNAPEFGWRHPAWAEPDGRLPEPWHWEFWGWEGASGGGETGSAKEYALQALGGDTLQFQCLERLWTGESNWNPHAENPSSGAYGIPQALPPEKMVTAGSDWRDNAITQVKWGLTYISDRYGTPCDAWAFWQSKNPHWY